MDRCERSEWHFRILRAPPQRVLRPILRGTSKPHCDGPRGRKTSCTTQSRFSISGGSGCADRFLVDVPFTLQWPPIATGRISVFAESRVIRLGRAPRHMAGVRPYLSHQNLGLEPPGLQLRWRDAELGSHTAMRRASTVRRLRSTRLIVLQIMERQPRYACNDKREEEIRRRSPGAFLSLWQPNDSRAMARFSNRGRERPVN